MSEARRSRRDERYGACPDAGGYPLFGFSPPSPRLVLVSCGYSRGAYRRVRRIAAEKPRENAWRSSREYTAFSCSR